MLDPAHPTAILRAAWRSVRLDAIRDVAREVIAELEALESGEERLASSSELGTDALTVPRRAALVACCDELREEAGLPALTSREDARRAGDDAWSRAYAGELARYRVLAGLSLHRLLDAR